MPFLRDYLLGLAFVLEKRSRKWIIWIVLIVILLVAAAKFDEKDGSTSCFIGLLSIIFGVVITIIAFGINPILGIIVGYFVLQGWKKS